MSIGDVNSDARGSGARYNDGKPAYDLIPLLALEDCARVFDYGKRKYAEWNWAKGMDWSVPFACIQRHLAAWQRGEDNDPESGLPHLGHVMCNLVMLSTFARTYPEGDDRPKAWLTRDDELARARRLVAQSIGLMPDDATIGTGPLLATALAGGFMHDEEPPLRAFSADEQKVGGTD